jgi:ribosomal protein L34E
MADQVISTKLNPYFTVQTQTVHLDDKRSTKITLNSGEIIEIPVGCTVIQFERLFKASELCDHCGRLLNDYCPIRYVRGINFTSNCVRYNIRFERESKCSDVLAAFITTVYGIPARRPCETLEDVIDIYTFCLSRHKLFRIDEKRISCAFAFILGRLPLLCSNESTKKSTIQFGKEVYVAMQKSRNNEYSQFDDVNIAKVDRETRNHWLDLLNSGIQRLESIKT